MKTETAGKSKKKEALADMQTEILSSTKPITNKIPEHGKATARIFIEGLSVLCLNEADKSAEIAFVSNHHSPVKIGVFKSGCDPVWIFKCDENKKTKIEIKKSHPVAVGKFYEDSKKYNEDYGWMPDLAGSDWHNGAKLDIKPEAKEYLSAKLVLQDAAFYTKINSIHDAVQENLDSGTKKMLPNVGRILGANIVCESADQAVMITITTKDESGADVVVIKPLPKDDGPYTITVGTKSAHAGNHLGLLYDHIISLPAGEPKFDLSYTSSETDFDYCAVSKRPVTEDIRRPVRADGEETIENTGAAKKPESIKTSDKKLKSIEFACQTFGGGYGPLPRFP